VGYPMGGDGISITAGIVSRIDWGAYSQVHDYGYRLGGGGPPRCIQTPRCLRPQRPEAAATVISRSDRKPQRP
jgi:hypothetical protein